MGVYYETIPPSLTHWVLAQKLLFVGTAPLSGTGHINISPKGGPYFGILNPSTFWFMDLTGSGVETTAHLYEPGNGRIVIMFMAFDGAPRIVRIWGTGRVLERFSGEFEDFVESNKVEVLPASRSIIMVDVHQCATSCGFSVPLYSFNGYRDTLLTFFEKKEKAFKAGKEEESMDRYWAWKSQLSVDGLPGLKRGVETAKKENVEPLKKWVGRWAPRDYRLGAYGNRQRGGELGRVLGILIMGMVLGATFVLVMVTPEGLGRMQDRVRDVRFVGDW